MQALKSAVGTQPSTSHRARSNSMHRQSLDCVLQQQYQSSILQPPAPQPQRRTPTVAGSSVYASALYATSSPGPSAERATGGGLSHATTHASASAGSSGHQGGVIGSVTNVCAEDYMPGSQQQSESLLAAAKPPSSFAQNVDMFFDGAPHSEGLRSEQVMGWSRSTSGVLSELSSAPSAPPPSTAAGGELTLDQYIASQAASACKDGAGTPRCSSAQCQSSRECSQSRFVPAPAASCDMTKAVSAAASPSAFHSSPAASSKRFQLTILVDDPADAPPQPSSSLSSASSIEHNRDDEAQVAESAAPATGLTTSPSGSQVVRHSPCGVAALASPQQKWPSLLCNVSRANDMVVLPTADVSPTRTSSTRASMTRQGSGASSPRHSRLSCNMAAGAEGLSASPLARSSMTALNCTLNESTHLSGAGAAGGLQGRSSISVSESGAGAPAGISSSCDGIAGRGKQSWSGCGSSKPAGALQIPAGTNLMLQSLQKVKANRIYRRTESKHAEAGRGALSTTIGALFSPRPVVFSAIPAVWRPASTSGLLSSTRRPLVTGSEPTDTKSTHACIGSHQQCKAVLRQDLQSIAGGKADPAAPGETVVACGRAATSQSFSRQWQANSRSDSGVSGAGAGDHHHKNQLFVGRWHSLFDQSLFVRSQCS